MWNTPDSEEPTNTLKGVAEDMKHPWFIRTHKYPKGVAEDMKRPVNYK